MAPQHDFILDNQNGAQFRADVNLALEAIATVSSGAVEPTTTYAYQYWADTTTGYLKQRDASNANWIVRGNLAADYGQAGQVLTSSGAGVPAIWTSITEDGAWTVAQDSTNAHFTFTGNGFDGTETNPDIYLVRGAVYKFTNASTTKGFQIQSTAGLSGTAYSDGITNNPALAPDSSTTETLVWTVQMDAPSELYYHSTVDAGPGGNIYILDEAGGGALEWTLTANGTTDYIFAGPGFAGTETDPDLYVVRGQTYKFTNGMGAHPFQIQSTQGTSGTAYNDGITNNAVSNGTLTWEVRMDAPSTLYYQCTAHADMNGTIYVLDEGSSVASIDDLGDVDTTTVAPTDGQALVWDAANNQWEPGTVSGGGGASAIDDLSDVDTSTVAPTNGQVLTWDGSQWEPATPTTSGLPAAQDGEALIYENGQWVAGPVIGGVDYTSGGDANFSSVGFLINPEGSNGSTSFTDLSNNAATITAHSSAQISTAQYKFGTSSAYFNGSEDRIQIPYASWMTFGSNDFTIEAWVYIDANSDLNGGNDRNAEIVTTLTRTSGSTNNSWSFRVKGDSTTTGTGLNFIYRQGGSAPINFSPTATVAQQTWHHIAAVRNGDTLDLYLNGISIGSTSVAGVSLTSQDGLIVGAFLYGSTQPDLRGYVDGLRITTGVARYTANFTPPTQAFETSAGSQVTIPASDSIRTLLSIDEYADDTAAGTGGVASGALYYNTTSSDYRLKS